METIEMLTQEETRRRVSIDFTLDDAQIKALTTSEGLLVPISVLTKDPRRNFDLRDEGGRAVPVLGKDQNGVLAHLALMSAVQDALPGVTDDVFEMLWADLRQVVKNERKASVAALDFFIGSAESGDRWRKPIWDDETCRVLMETLWAEYALFAVLDPDSANRRVLKYSYGEDFDPTEKEPGRPLLERLSPGALFHGARYPDRKRFVVLCPGAWRARSFHVEVAIPEELRIDIARLHNEETNAPLSTADLNTNRASLYLDEEIGPDDSAFAYVVVSPERHGHLSEAAATGLVVAGLLWLGVISDLDADNPGPAASILLGGAALFSGVSAAKGQHKLVTAVFSSPRRWLVIVTLAALAGAACLAFEIPGDPVRAWCYAATACTVAALRLSWSALRAPS